jgi:hypothetical protein
MVLLAEAGKSDYIILIPEEASSSQEWAAKQLNKYMRKSVKCDFPIEKGSQLLNSKVIVLGDNISILNELIPRFDLSTLGEEGFYIKTIGDTIIIAGSKVRGTVYGVFTFLEDYVGCRFYAPDIEIIPDKETIELPDIDNIQIPDFEYRIVTYFNFMEPKYTVKSRCNMNPFSEEKYGGGYIFSMQHMSHTFYQLISPKKYFKEHPEYFALVDGERQSNDAQLCLTNPDVIKIAKEQVLKWIEIDPISISFGVIQNDVDRYCECDNCKKLDEQEESHSGTILSFVNEIARAVKEKHPDKYIHTIAYTYSEKPPKTIKPDENVIVVLCHMHPSCDNHALETCPIDQAYVNNLKGWLKISDQVMVWHYVVDFKHYLLPFPNFYSISKDIPFYKKLGVIGFLGQAGFSAEQEFQELRNYVSLKLAWNVNTDLNKLYNEYFKDVYGPAGELVHKYFDLLPEKAKLPNVHMHLYSGLEAGYIDEDFMRKSIELFEKADELVQDAPIYAKRLRRTRMSIDFLVLLSPSEYILKLGVLSPKNLESKLKVLRRFKEAIKEFKVSNWGEDIPMKKFLEYCDEIYRQHPFEGLIETAPIVMKIINELLVKVNSVIDDNDNFQIRKMAGSVLKYGLDPRTLMQWFQDRHIAAYNENNIWERKILPENIKKMLNPKLPEADLKLIKAIAGEYLDEK